MKLHEVLPIPEHPAGIRRKNWKYFLVRPVQKFHAPVRIDMDMLEIGEYKLAYDDLVADDWEIVE